MFNVEKKIQHRLMPFLKGPDLCQFALLRARGDDDYRSSGLALLAWGTAFLRRFFYPVMLWVALPFLLLMLMLLFFPDEPLWVLVHLAAAVLAAELFFGLLFHPHVTLERQLPRRADEGSFFTVRFTVTNRGRLAAEPLKLDPFDYVRFALNTEKTAQLPPLKRGETAVAEARVFARRRGVWQLYRARAEMAFPFGLIRFQCIAPRRKESLITVWPKRLNAAFWAAAEKMRESAGASRRGRTVADPAAEVTGIREYRPGDPLRRIDWIGTARRGEFLVKQFERPAATRRLTIAVDAEELRTPLGCRRHPLTYAPSFERVLAIARALAWEAAEEGVRPERLLLGHRLRQAPADLAPRPCAAVLCDELASARPERPREALFALPEGVCDETVVILQRDDPRRRTAVIEIAARTAGKVTVFCIAPAGYAVPPGWITVPEAGS